MKEKEKKKMQVSPLLTVTMIQVARSYLKHCPIVSEDGQIMAASTVNGEQSHASQHLKYTRHVTSRHVTSRHVTSRVTVTLFNR